MSSAISHDLRKAVLGEHDVDHKKALMLNNVSVVAMGIVASSNLLHSFISVFKFLCIS
jgi:Na+(H+)/acetate symporter ActP